MRPIPRIVLILFLTTLLLSGVYLLSIPIAKPLPRYSVRGPSIFPKSAIIALADDRSTFFLARPAAFGPELPEEEEEGRVWKAVMSLGAAPIGLTGRLVEAGEDGCADVPPPKEEGDGGDEGEDEDQEEDNNRKKGIIGEVDEKRIGRGKRRTSSAVDFRGMIVLIPRGGCGFLEKVLWAQVRGAIAVVVGDNIGGRGLVTMYAKGDTSNILIPSVFTTHTTAQLLISLMPPTSTNPTTPPVNEKEGGVRSEGLWPPVHRKEGGVEREGLWVTLTSTPGPANPFLDTLLVLVVSPLGTLGIVYSEFSPILWTGKTWKEVNEGTGKLIRVFALAMLAIRARIQRRRWRAPKSIVESLPVRVYTTPMPSPRLGPIQSPPPPPPPPALPTLPPPQRAQTPPPTATMSTELPPSAVEVGGQVQDGVQGTSLQPQQQQQQQQQQPLPQHMISGNTPSSSLECVVCLEDYVPHVSRVMKLPCGHEFHVGCITPWLVTRRRTCPICKGDVVKMVREKGGVVDDSISEEGAEEGERPGGDLESASFNGNGAGSSSSSGGGGGGGGSRSGSGSRSGRSGRRRRGANATASPSSSPRGGAAGGWRSWVVGIVGGGRGRSVRSLVERDGPERRVSASGSGGGGGGGSGAAQARVDERTPLISDERRESVG
ncbi:hypothetical protein DFH27DRAFT_617345 [Peziza echinospora]|nr:hypothetical protein DFH27DRAFT_617345 [Peziza echinospora]